MSKGGTGLAALPGVGDEGVLLAGGGGGGGTGVTWLIKEFIGFTVLPGLGGEVLCVWGGGGGVTGITWVGGKGGTYWSFFLE